MDKLAKEGLSNDMTTFLNFSDILTSLTQIGLKINPFTRRTSKVLSFKNKLFTD